MKITCPSCGNDEKFYKLKDGRLKCSVCKKYFTPEKKIIHISEKDLKKILKFFIEEESTNKILKEVKITKFKLLKIKKVLRDEIKKQLKNKLTFKPLSSLSKNLPVVDKCCSILENANADFISFLEKNLKNKRGIRENKIQDFIFEYFWKFQNQTKAKKEKEKILFDLIKDKVWFE